MLQKIKFNREMKIFFGRDLATVDQHHAQYVEPSSQKVILILMTHIPTLGFNIKVTDLDVIAIKGIFPNREPWPKESRERPQGL